MFTLDGTKYPMAFSFLQDTIVNYLRQSAPESVQAPDAIDEFAALAEAVLVEAQLDPEEVTYYTSTFTLESLEAAQARGIDMAYEFVSSYVDGWGTD